MVHPTRLVAFSALHYYIKLNVWGTYDPSHCTGRAWDATAREMNVWDFSLLMMISDNLVHGPDRDQGRYNQVRACLSEVHWGL